MSLSLSRKYLISVLFSVLVVAASLFLPKTFYSDNELADIKCGWPLSFIQGHSIRNPPFPYKSSCMNAFGGSTMDIGGLVIFLWFPFFLDITIVFILCVACYKLYQLSKKDKII